MVRIGTVEISALGAGFSLPHNRSQAKACLRNIAKMCGTKVYFVRTTKAPYGGLYDHKNKRLIVVEQQGKSKVAMLQVVLRFFHELTHHLHQEGGIFLAYYFDEVMVGRRKKKFSQADSRRIALRAEKHANLKACELAKEFFGIEMIPQEYSKVFLERQRPDIYGTTGR